MLSNLKILFHQGKQYIPDVTTAQVPGIFKGRPVISSVKVDENSLAGVCPTNAISTSPVSIDLGKCTFCGECAIQFPEKISFTKDYKLSSNSRERLIIREGFDQEITLDPELIRPEIHRYFGRSLKLRQVSAGGDNSCEWELNASNNVQFDISRFGIDFVASPRHADGIVITGPISVNMAEPLERCYKAIPDPKIIILAGIDAISGGIYSGSPALNRTFLENNKIDLYIPGNPVHPLTFINGVLSLIRKYEYKFKESFTIGSALRLTETVCLWEFISVSADSTIWKVKEIMNGYRVHIRDYGTPLQTKDTALIKDSVTIGTWVYSIHSDRRILTHTYDWFPRFLQSEATDTCIRAYELCLKKNAGILRSFHINWSNYDGREYDLIKGPYY